MTDAPDPPEPSPAPVHLVNATQIQTGPYGMILLCDLRRHNGATVPGPELHFSLEHAKVVANLMVRQIRDFEANHGAIPIPKELAREILVGTEIGPKGDPEGDQ